MIYDCNNFDERIYIIKFIKAQDESICYVYYIAIYRILKHSFDKYHIFIQKLFNITTKYKI